MCLGKYFGKYTIKISHGVFKKNLTTVAEKKKSLSKSLRTTGLDGVTFYVQ